VKVPARFRVGVATHTGLVRTANEDDYLLVAPPGARPVLLLAAVADGMGGVAGGTEASRSGLRGLAAGLLSAADVDLAAAVRSGFAGASERVAEQARLVPALHEMGTTLTALACARDTAVIGHVGDSRAYLLRLGRLERLTTDHAMQDQRNRLLRCIGGGQPPQDPDLIELALLDGDRLLLCSDGIWGVVDDLKVRELLSQRPAVAAAEGLVAAALAAGGPDNGTALVVDVVAAPADSLPVDVELSGEEVTRLNALHRGTRLGPSRWPWLVLALAFVLMLLAVLRSVFGIDLLAHLFVSL
jgi:protein phosphatase